MFSNLRPVGSGPAAPFLHVRTALLLTSLLGLAAFGCVSPGGYPQVGPNAKTSGKPLLQFPKRQDIERSARPTEIVAPTPHQEIIFDWTFEESRATGTEPWDETLAHTAADHPEIRTGDDLNCVAREIARVFQETGKFPDDRFQRYASARCGLGSTGIALFAQQLHLTGNPKPAWIWSKMQELGYLKPLEQMIRSEPNALGMSVVHDQNMATLALVSAHEDVILNEVNPRVEDDTVTVSGKVRTPGVALQVAINHGEFDHAVCHLATDGERFESRCPIAKDDEVAWFEVSTLESEAVLATAAARGMASRGELPSKYEATPVAEAHYDEATFFNELGRTINEVRSRAKLEPLRIDLQQSKETDYLLPYLEDAHRAGDRKMEAMLALGALAGWHLEEEIRDGGLYLTQSPAASPSSWLESVLDSPMARSVLFGRSADVLSLGVKQSTGHQTSVLVTTWELFGSENHETDRLAAIYKLNQERERAGQSRAVIASNLPELREAAQQVRNGERSPEHAVNRAAQLAAQRLGRQVWGMYLEGYDLDHLSFPERLVAQKKLFTEIQVTHYKPKGAAWAQLAVLVLLVPITEA